MDAGRFVLRYSQLFYVRAQNHFHSRAINDQTRAGSRPIGGKTLEDAFREWLDWYASRKVTREEIEALYRSLKHVDAGGKFSRDEMNER